MRHGIPKIAYLLLAVTALGFPVTFAVLWGLARGLGLEIAVLYLAVGALLLTGLADLVLAIANERFNQRPEAKLHQLNEPIGDEAVVVDGFTLQGATSRGRVRAQGHIWTAQCEGGELLKSGQTVKVTDRQGLTLFVTPVS